MWFGNNYFDCRKNHHVVCGYTVRLQGLLFWQHSAGSAFRKPELWIQDVFMMDNLNFLNDFAVFNEIFSSEHSLPVAKYMNDKPLSAALDTPLIQLTLMLTRQGGGNVYIVDSENKIKGFFSMDSIISKVLRG